MKQSEGQPASAPLVPKSESVTHPCPCCKQDVTVFAPTIFGSVVVYGDLRIRLTEREMRIMRLLVASFGKEAWIPTDKLIYELYLSFGSREPENALNTIRVFVHKIKQKLRHSPLKIESVYARGYRLVTKELPNASTTPEHKKAI